MILSTLITASGEAFSLGTERTFSLLNNVEVYDLKYPNTPIGYQISGSVKVGAVWENVESTLQLLKFEVIAAIK